MSSKLVYSLCNKKAALQLWRCHPLCTCFNNKQRMIHSATTAATGGPSYSTSTRKLSIQPQSSNANSTRTGALQDVEISKRLRLIKPGSSQSWPYSVNPERILIVLLPWLNSKEKHVNKYVQLYSDMGLDVLCMKSKPEDFLWPPTSFGVARELSEVLKEHTDYDHYIFHTMSIGSYNLTTFRVLAKDVQEISELSKKVCGIIYDSIVIGAGRGGALETSGKDNDGDVVDRFVKGIAGSVKGSKFILPVATVIAKAYFSLTKKQTLDYYEKAYGVVRDEPPKVPTLLFASKNDPMCDKDVVEQLVKIWKDKHDVPITLQMWDKSGHAQHLSFHRKEYIDLLRHFLDGVFCGMEKSATGSGNSVRSKL